MKQNILKDKSYEFALRVVKLSLFLSKEYREFVLSRQVLRPGTSIVSNIEEAFQGESKADFIHKLAIANKEAYETNYSLRLLRDSGLITVEQAESMISDCIEIQKMLTAAIKTSKGK